MNIEKKLISRIFRFCLLVFICTGLGYSIIKTDIFYIILFFLSFLSFLYLMWTKYKNK